MDLAHNSLKLISWNINQRGGQGKEIPEMVVKEIHKQNADIVVLTEFRKANNWVDFVTRLQVFGYKVTCNTECYTNPDGKVDYYNEILIAVKDYITIEKVVEIPNVESNPDFLQVETSINEKPLTIIGVRVKTLEFKKRMTQLKELIEKIKKEDNAESASHNIPIIIIGDFNNAKIYGCESKCYDDVKDEYRRRGQDIYNTYNYHMMKDKLKESGFCIHTPKDKYSFGFTNSVNSVENYGYDVFNENGSFKEDHLATTKGVTVLDVDYDAKFLTEAYVMSHHVKKRGNAYYDISPPYPDHAVLTATVRID